MSTRGATAQKTDTRIYLADLREFSTKGDLAIIFKRGGDLFQIDGQEFAISFLAQDRTPVDPRLVLGNDDGFPYLDLEELKELPGQTEDGAPGVFRLERRQGRGPRMGVSSWAGMQALCSQAVGRDVAATRPEMSFRTLLAASGVIDPAFLEVADRAREDNETLGQALIRLELCTPRELVFAAMGPAHVFNPTCHLANAIGQVLLENGAISGSMLEQALQTQVRDGGSLARILLEQGCSPRDLAQGAKALRNWPVVSTEADKTTEILIGQGLLSRTELLSSALQIQSSGRPLKDYLVEAQICSAQAIARAEELHALKLRLRTAGRIRLGEVLIAQKALRAQDLMATLKEQIACADPLGELLMRSGRVSPEAVIAGLQAQENQLTQLMEATEAGNDEGLVAKMPLFDLPSLDSAPKKNKKKRPPGKARSRGKSRKRRPSRRIEPKVLLVGAVLLLALPAVAYAGVLLAGRIEHGGPALLANRPHPAASPGDLPSGVRKSAAQDNAVPSADGISLGGGAPGTVKAPLSNLSDADLKKIVANHPEAYIDPKDIEKNSGRIEEVLKEAAKHDPHMAAMLKMAERSSGADIAKQEIAAARNGAPAPLPVSSQGQGPSAAQGPSAGVAAPAQAPSRQGQDLVAGLVVPPPPRPGANPVLEERQLVTDLKLNEVLIDSAKASRAALYRDLGRVKFEHGKDAGAIADFRQAVQLDGLDADSHFYLGRVLLAQTKVRLADGQLRTALHLAPEGPHAVEIRQMLGARGSKRR